MRITRNLLLFATFLFVSFASYSQGINTFSPYSRYGIGEVRTRGYANNKALGGISQGIRNDKSVNFLNPASYSSQDSMSFIFDFGLEAIGVDYRTNSQSNFNSGANLHHLAIQFPMTKWLGVSAGIQPFSNVGYRLKYTEDDDNLLSSIGAIKYYHFGKGGITQSYFGLAFEPFEGFSVGTNLSYFFGSLEHSVDVVFPDDTPYGTVNKLNSIVVCDIGLSFGAQWAFHLGAEKQLRVVLGATLDNETKLGAQNIQYISYPLGNTIDTIQYNELSDAAIDFPKNLTAGFSLAYKNIFMVGADYSVQDWTNSGFMGQSANLTKSETVRVGIQYTPSPNDLRSYLKRVSYRGGFYNSKTYLQFDDNQINDYGITFGVGLPFRRTNTSFNISCEVGRKGNTDYIQETYGVFNVGFTFYDFWFIKRKYN